MDLTEAVYHSAIEAIRRCCCPAGLRASGQPEGHRQIWARDSMISALGARFSYDAEIHRALRASIALLRRHQTPAGAIPNNVDPDTQRPNFRAYADCGLWWIIGSILLAPNWDAIRSVLRFYECQEVDQSGLLSMQESSDWQDLFCTRGKGLYLNCLYVVALRAVGNRERATHVAECVNTWFWYRGDGDLARHISHTFSTEGAAQNDSLGRKRWLPEKRVLINDHYYLPYLGFRAVGEWFDAFGNLLAILAGVAGEEQSAAILDLVQRHSMNQWPLRSLTPAVQPGDPDWRDYYGDLNVPHHYHNGGVWPFLGGYYVAALVKAGRREEATAALKKLAGLNESGGFNEWHHGQTGEAMGVRDQAWSAAMYLFAFECVKRGCVPAPFSP